MLFSADPSFYPAGLSLLLKVCVIHKWDLSQCLEHRWNAIDTRGKGLRKEGYRERRIKQTRRDAGSRLFCKASVNGWATAQCRALAWLEGGSEFHLQHLRQQQPTKHLASCPIHHRRPIK